MVRPPWSQIQSPAICRWTHSIRFPVVLICVFHLRITGWWFGTWILFSPIVGMMIQSDFHIFQGGRYTTNQVDGLASDYWKRWDCLKITLVSCVVLVSFLRGLEEWLHLTIYTGLCENRIYTTTFDGLWSFSLIDWLIAGFLMDTTTVDYLYIWLSN
jgi:hypothetical protein